MSEPILEGPYQVPPGFVVETLADDAQVGSLVQLTFDSNGLPVVSKERSHPVRLLDNDGDGTFETQQVISDQVENCQGIWFDGSTLYANCTNPADGEACLFRLPDTDGDGTADSREILVQYTGRIGEHGPHDIRRAPDGSISVLLGNHTFLPAGRITLGSPLRNYRESQLLERYMDARGHAAGRTAPGGAVFRVEQDGSVYSLQFGGFRNPYNHAYNLDGEAFTFDSDMEWDINLPWYREVRSVHGIPGADYGWRTGSGKFPDYFADSLPPVDDLGRGSPVGVEFYHSYAYPPEYFDAFLQGDWSRGRVVLSRFKRSGATYELAEPTTDFLYGEPLNVTDLEVGPDGLVYFTMGGRGTRGGFYRVAYKGHRANAAYRPASGILSVVRQPQPLSAFSHAYFQEQQGALGEAWAAQLQALVRDETAAVRDRAQALHLLQRYGPHPEVPLIRAAFASESPLLRAAAMYVTGQPRDPARIPPQAAAGLATEPMSGRFLAWVDRIAALASEGLADGEALVRRRAAEALVRQSLQATADPVALYALLGDADRFVRWAGRMVFEVVIGASPREPWQNLVIAESDPTAAVTGMLALVRTAPSSTELEAVLEKTLSMLESDGLDMDDELGLLRVFHLACLEVEGGCRRSLRDRIHDIVSARFPAEDEALNREYARTLAYASRPEAIDLILARIPAGAENQPLQIHYVYCLRTIKHGWTAEQKRTLLTWFRKAKDWRGGASFPGFINRLFESSLEFFDEQERQVAYAAIPEYAPVDDEALLASLRRRDGHVQPNVFARKSGTNLYSETEIFEYMMYDPMTTLATREQGVEVYEKACARCHRLGDLGKDYGPDLTTIANRFTRRDMLEAVLWPSREISDQYGSWRIETDDGVYSAMILEEDEDSITILIPDLDRPVTIQRKDILDMRESDVSIMPEGLLDEFEMRQTAGLFRLLQETASGEGGD